MAAKGSAITAGLVIGTMSNEHWQTPGPSWTARTPVVQTVGECSKNTAARPPAPTIVASSPVSFHAAITASPAVTVRRRCARITARTGPKLEIAA